MVEHYMANLPFKPKNWVLCNCWGKPTWGSSTANSWASMEALASLSSLSSGYWVTSLTTTKMTLHIWKHMCLQKPGYTLFQRPGRKKMKQSRRQHAQCRHQRRETHETRACPGAARMRGTQQHQRRWALHGCTTEGETVGPSFKVLYLWKSCPHMDCLWVHTLQGRQVERQELKSFLQYLLT